MQVPDKFNHEEEEQKWLKMWHENDMYAFSSGDNNFVIDTPPPTVSGSMHLGHAFSYAQQDFIARYKRQRGFNVCYPFGTDDNGLPTERLVERTKKVRSTHMDRLEFIKLCNETITEIKPEFINDWKVLGMSCDFSGSYSTIDKHCIKTSQAEFIDLYNKGLVHQQEAPVIWDTQFQSAVAQAELESIDKKSHFNDITFIVDGKPLTIATTRPELLPSCVAVIAHPDDDRYKDLIGKQAQPPLMDFTVPIFSDDKVDPEKGSGIVMCCTFGDKTDIEWWKQFKLPLKASIGKDGKMTDLAGKYAGLSVLDARKQIIDDLKEANLLTAQKEIMHAVNTHEKSGREVEFLNTKQWFINVLDRKQELVDVADQITWYPEYMKKRYTHWVQNLNWDWCISRQRHFGVPFPVWYEKDTGKVIVASKDELPVDPISDKPKNYSGNPDNLIAEQDVMDTWATSSVTPQIICNMQSKGEYTLSQEHFPNALRPQGHDIIRTWAFYTIVRSLYNYNTVPWKDIVITGHVLDPKGKKMSKSKGNVIDPRNVFSKYGSDVMRFWAAAGKLGDDLAYQEKELNTGKKTLNKLWNACKFAHSHVAEFDEQAERKMQPIDEWALNKLANTLEQVQAYYDEYEYSKARQEIDMLFWRVLCDNYMEIIKERLYNPDVHSQESYRAAQYTLKTLISACIKLYASIMPFITESCYQYYFKEDAPSVHLTTWPQVTNSSGDFGSLGDQAIEALSVIRKSKSQNGDALNAPLASLTIKTPFAQAVETFKDDLKMASKSDQIIVEQAEEFEVTYQKKEIKES